MTSEVYDPNRRQHYRFSRDGDDVVVDIRVAPGGDGPLHYHPLQEERWTVVSGRVRFRVGRSSAVPPAGEEVVVPAGVKHAFKNVGDSEAVIRAVVRPGLEIEAFLRDGAALAREGAYTRRGFVKGPRAAVKMAAFLDRYRDIAVMCWPPPVVQRVLMKPLLRFAR